MNDSPAVVSTTMTACRWFAHSGHVVPPWSADLRRELVAALRRGSMNAERCLRTYQAQGERDVLPPEAVAYLAARVVAERMGGPGERGAIVARVGVESLRDHGERELAELRQADPEAFATLIEAGRRFFFAASRSVG